ncbi:MAG: zinc ABC transporter substrate-binding protein [Candidatus Bathyarchaeia archaeon]|jgi:zinc/manganese transport system substrate-binding protein
MEKKLMGIAAALVVIILAAATFAGLYLTNQNQSTQSTQTTQAGTYQASKISVVAGENFWGSLISQLGGSRTQVLSIVTDPNADPHEYSSNSQNAQAIANAAFVVVNGAGYDDWALKLIAASNSPHQVVLNVADLLGKKAGDNPHFWYSPYYVNDTVKAMYLDLISIDPGDTGYFTQQYASLNASLGQYNARISEIRQQFAGTRVAATEDIFVYVANATGLNLVSPPAFMEAVAEGNDPSAQSVVQFQQLIQNGNFSVLVYNAQTVTPLTQNIKAMAAAKGIPIVAITETIQPPDVSFQDWMNAELITLQNALNAQALGG